jgi:hypothetical protein
MPRTNLWNRTVPRVELDQRSREARLRYEQVERLLLWRAAVRQFRLQRALYLFRVGMYRGAQQESRVTEPLSDRPPFCMAILGACALAEALPL